MQGPASPESPTETTTTISRASAIDIPAIKAIIDAAYTKYIPRIGKPPAPMSTDYNDLLSTHEIYTLWRSTKVSSGPDSQSDRVVGSVVLRFLGKTLHINNLVVDPSQQGKGYGKILMTFAEDLARERGCESVELYTNVKMFENLLIYERAGFDEVERRVEDGFERVYFRKRL